MWKKLINNLRVVKYFYEADLNQVVGSFESSAFKFNFTASDYLRIAGNTYNRNSDFQEGVGKIVTACLGLPLCVKDEKGTISEITPEVKDFINNPMATGCNWKSFLESCFIQYYIGGEVFLLDYKVKSFIGKSTNLFLVWPNEVTKIKNKEGRPHSFKVSQSFYKRNGILGQTPAEFSSEFKKGLYINDMAYFKKINPISADGRGLSTVVSILNDIEILVKGRQWNRSVLHNEGRPSGVFFYPANSKQAINPGGGRVAGENKVNEEIKQNFAGSGNAGKALFLRGGLQFQAVGQSMKDVDFIQGIRFSRETVANILGIPLQMFGSQEKSSYNNMTEARQSFHNDTCIPMMNNFLEFLSSQIFYKNGMLSEGKVVAVNTEKTDVANSLRMEKMKVYDKLNFLTINEKRENCGLDKSSDLNADSIIVPSTLTPIEELGLGADNMDDMDDEDNADDMGDNGDKNNNNGGKGNNSNGKKDKE